MKEDNVQAQMSVYLALMLGVLIPLVLLMIEGARSSAIKLYLECAVELGMNSIQAEYNRELLSQYDLLFIDTAYEQPGGSLDHLREHMTDYLEEEFHPARGLLLANARDFYGLSLNSIEVVKVSRATDQDGAVFRAMAIAYMLEHYGIAYVTDLQDFVDATSEVDLASGNIMQENDDAQAAIDSIEIPKPEEEDAGSWTEPEIENPTEGMNTVRNLGVLPVVCKNEISTQSIAPEDYASARSLICGDGLCDDWVSTNPVAEELLFTEYILEKCGCYTAPKSGSLLQYETEYIIVGKSVDSDNLRAIADRLLLIRGAANTAYFFTDSSLCTQAKTMASSLALVLSFPEFEVIFEAAIIAAWIYAESLVDVRELFEGRRVPLIKVQGDWNLSLENALGLTAQSVDTTTTQQAQSDQTRGLGYEDYLRILLYTLDSTTKTQRMMDIVEMDVRNVEGYESFCLDNCIAAATFQFIFESSYGYTIFMEREMRYM